ncbi:MATE family efflux transporter [Alishewanella sp. 16-MA]|uniref:MATE family efflux transporter n=1 Tax=Alishewanella maricola TaxID=2795740 RepID=A0ABS8C0W8_9ALTE|nr:MATE family efflux transporter [Alishewanella maricola]MCB5225953.1 MATE family efflux transporter [Alishewanella maricola]
MSTNPLLTASMAPLLKRLTWPVMGGMLTLMSFNLVDTFFISLLGTQQLAAISFTFPVTFTLISLAIGLSIGTSAIIAKALGAGQTDTARADSLAALWLSAILVSILALLGYLLLEPLFFLLGATPEIFAYIERYMLIWLAGSILLVTPMVGNAILRAAGDTKIPSLVMAGSGVINAILDPILIFGIGPIPAMGISGAAIATVISWLAGFVFILYWLSVKRGLLTAWILPWGLFGQICRKILHIGLPAAGANMLTPVAMAILTAIMASYGPEAVAAFGVGARIESIASLVVLALSMTLPPVISQNFGASRFDRVKEAYQLCCRFVMFWQAGTYLILALLAYPIAAMFTDNADVASYLRWFIWLMPLAYGLQGIIILTNSSFNALHLPAKAVVLSVIRLFVCYVPLAWLGGVVFGVVGIFIGCILANLLTAAVAYYWFNRVQQRYLL